MRRNSSTSLHEVAELAGVSIMTVSRVINNQPNVSDKTRKIVQEAIQELNYQPSVIAQSLVRKKTNIIGLVIYTETGVHPTFFHEIINGAQSGASKLGYDLLIFSQNEKQEYSNRIIRSRLVDGVILMGVFQNNQDIIQLHKEKFPYVMVGRRDIGEIDPFFVAPDYADGTEKATQYLIDLGHKKMGFIGASRHFEPDFDKLIGYQKALFQNLIAFDPNLAFEKSVSQRDGYQAMKKLLEFKPTAVIVNNTYSTIGAIMAIRDEGMKIPEDISIIGFDDNQELNKEFNHLLDLEMTMLRIPKITLGESAARMAVSLINNQVLKKQNFLEMEFIVQKSCSRILGNQADQHARRPKDLPIKNK